ncbi:MAG TPA: hypothetical protein PKN32_04710 [Bacteroidales bacterium]|nr:hypothetical protein [Bacteroidales bacterium]
MKILNYYRELFPELVKLKGMISENERKFLFHYASKVFSGQGMIVDLGCWLGATTVSMALGLKAGGKLQKPGKKIYVYDLFKWNHVFNQHVVGTELENLYNDGDDFIGEYENNIKQFKNIIETRRDIISSGWHGENIEFLLIDAMKTPEVTKSILTEFYPFLMPNVSFVYHQDFDHYLTPWVHILIYLHRPYVKHIHDVPGAGGTVFKCIKFIPDEVLSVDFMSLTENDTDEAFKYCKRIAHKSKYSGIAAAHVMYYVLQNKFDKAFYVWSDYLWEGYKLNSDFIDVKNLLDKARNRK